MISLVADQRANDGELIAHLCQLGKGFADVHARDVGMDRFPRTGEFLWGFGFQVEHVLVGRSADEVDHDDGFGRPALPCVFGGLQDGRQRPATGSTECGEGADVEQSAAGDAIAEGGAWG